MRRDDIQLPDPPPDDRPAARWQCGRAGQDSACARGPLPGGRCPLADPCRVRRTWYGRRKQISFWTMMVLVVIVTTALCQSDPATVFKPGKLATPHAQILAATLTSDRCASCHPQAATDSWRWFTAGANGHKDVSMSDRCTNCHHQTIDPDTAMVAHNLPLTVRRQMAAQAIGAVSKASWHQWLPRPTVDSENIQCSVCHREHHGPDADLMAVTNAQCQTCHSNRFGRFAASHPDWDQWPYRGTRAIAFDHASHANKHYPASATDATLKSFDCSQCHARSDRGEPELVTGYQDACQRCHQAALKVEIAGGVDLIALPSLDSASSSRIRSWPENATGFYDGSIAPLARLLMQSDPRYASSWTSIPGLDFSRVDPHDPKMMTAAESIAAAHLDLMDAIVDGGQPEMVRRFEAAGIDEATVAPLLRTLPPQLIESALREWITSIDQNKRGPSDKASSIESDREPKHARSRDEEIETQGNDDLLDGVSLDDDLLDGDLLDADALDGVSLDDALLNDALQGGGDLKTDALDLDPGVETSFGQSHESNLSPSEIPSTGPSASVRSVTERVPLGGWYRDDVRMAIRYRGGDHADTVLKAIVEIAGQLPVADSRRDALLRMPAVASCVRCHPGAVDHSPRWTTSLATRSQSLLTKFSHRPHLNIAQLSDCRHCHQVWRDGTERGLATSSGLETLSPVVRPISSRSSADSHSSRLTAAGLSGGVMGDFRPLDRQACAVCHTPSAAGDRCVTCHRYHSHADTLRPQYP